MKSFNETRESINETLKLSENDFNWLNESERAQVEELIKDLSSVKLEEMEKTHLVISDGGSKDPESTVEEIKKILEESELLASVTLHGNAICVFAEKEEDLEAIQSLLMKEAGFSSKVEEGLIGSILGGLTGFIIGPSIGKVIANALGIEKGIVYDMLTSRLASAAMGAALTKYIGGKPTV
jgi:hypothetical protein